MLDTASLVRPSRAQVPLLQFVTKMTVVVRRFFMHVEHVIGLCFYRPRIKSSKHWVE